MTTDRVRALWYVNPDRVTEDVTKSGKLKYKVTTGGSTMMVDATGMLHVVGPMSDAGYTGRSVITTFRETLGLGLALERYGSEFFANAATPRRVLSTSARLSTEAHARLRTSLNDAQTGPGRRHNPRARRGGHVCAHRYQPRGFAVCGFASAHHRGDRAELRRAPPHDRRGRAGLNVLLQQRARVPALAEAHPRSLADPHHQCRE
jgi:hypothetical protein